MLPGGFLYPLETDYFKYTSMLPSEVVSMISGYNKTTESIDRDLVELLATFSPLQWLSVGVVLMIFSLVLYCGRKHVYKVKRPESIWIVSMFFLDQDYLKEVTFFLKILSIVMSLFSFIMLQLLQCSASTDLVKMKEPIAVKSFKDILSRDDVQVFWLRGMNSIKPFKFAPDGSIEKRIWDQKSYPDERNLVDFKDLKQIFNRVTECVRSTKATLIFREAQTKVYAAITCRTLRRHLSDFDTNVLLSYGTEFRKEFLVATVVSKYIDPDIFKRLVIR